MARELGIPAAVDLTHSASVSVVKKAEEMFTTENTEKTLTVLGRLCYNEKKLSSQKGLCYKISSPSNEQSAVSSAQWPAPSRPAPSSRLPVSNRW
jgi:hypothetical protein